MRCKSIFSITLLHIWELILRNAWIIQWFWRKPFSIQITQGIVRLSHFNHWSILFMISSIYFSDGRTLVWMLQRSIDCIWNRFIALLSAQQMPSGWINNKFWISNNPFYTNFGWESWRCQVKENKFWGFSHDFLHAQALTAEISCSCQCNKSKQSRGSNLFNSSEISLVNFSTNFLTQLCLQELIHEHSFIALNYQEELSKWASPEYYDSNVLRVQLPYVAPVSTPGLTVEQQKERKRELARRLMEINARKREERVLTTTITQKHT